MIQMSEGKFINIKGAKVNNLKNIDVTIPRNKLVVITGLSGSGKSSLAFDTLYAEGQRRYVESLSSYARQFLGRMAKPDCEYIKGLPPAIAIEQKVTTRNARSTVGTSTEIYDYLRLLYARIGKTYSPTSGSLVKKHSPEDVLRFISSFPINTRFAVLSPIVCRDGKSLIQQLDVLMKEGYSRVECNSNIIEISELITQNNINKKYPNLHLLIDRMTNDGTQEMCNRLYDSTETAFFEGAGKCIIKVWDNENVIEQHFSTRFEADGITFEEPTDLMFNFNNPVGACPECEGYGKIMGIAENLVIPNKNLSVFQDAVVCWKGEKMSEWKKHFIHIASKTGFPIHRPYNALTESEIDFLWNGNTEFSGINGFFKWVESKNYGIQYRVMLARYRGKTTCPVCHGTRLKNSANYVKVAGYTISNLVKMPISQLSEIFATIQLDKTDKEIAQRLLFEINNRLHFLNQIGLSYLTLDRVSSTLSGGECQRINLATSLGSSLVGSLYILDEPSIGLHSRDTKRLIDVLKSLRDIGNTVVVVEHDEDIIRASDYLIDVGPLAGSNGGNIIFQGKVNQMSPTLNSYTLKYMNGELQIPVPKKRRKWNSYIEVKGASEHNLKNIDVKFPLGVMTVVTGVSGSGKSTLVREILYKALCKYLDISNEIAGQHSGLTGDINRIGNVEFIDQNPIGKSSRSNPATYLKAFDEIRRLFSEQQGAKQMDFTAGYFSFNTPGGRCEECKGEGTITVPMQFMADITLECEECHGKRFKQDVLDIYYYGKNISDILDLTIDDAINFFSQNKGITEQRIIKRLKPLQDVGLGYIKLGQSSSTLSGGENQRVKLAYYIAEEKSVPTMFIFDEPTTGLHFHDINTLMQSFEQLLKRGHTIVIIEHNMDVIKCADYIIDIGPEGGNNGGKIVCTGTPEDVAKCTESYTGKFLINKLK